MTYILCLIICISSNHGISIMAARSHFICICALTLWRKCQHSRFLDILKILFYPSKNLTFIEVR